jgi:hypothetical protein
LTAFIAFLATRKEDKDKLALLNDYFQAAVDNPMWTDYVDNAIKDFEFEEGTQWDKDDADEVIARGQAPIVENEIHPIIQDLMGTYESLKTRVSYRGRNLGQDEADTEVLNKLILHAQQESDYEFEESDMAHDGFVSGMGVMEVFAEIDDALQPKLIFKAEDALNVFPDPNSRRYDWNIDARFICRAKWMDWDDAKVKWPHAKKQIASLAHHDPIKNATSEFKRENYVDERTNKVRPVEVWYKTYEKRRIAIVKDATVDLSKLDKKQEKAFMEKNPEAQVLESNSPKMNYAVFIGVSGGGGGGILLESGKSPYKHNLFPFVPFFIFKKKSGEPYSIVRLLIDPQTEVNKRRSKALHHLLTNQVVMDENAVRNKDDAKKELSKPDGIIEKKPGKEFIVDKNVEVAQTQMVLLSESKDAIRRISGVTNNASELPREVRSGVGLARAQRISDVKKIPQFKNLRRSRKMIFTIALELIKQYYTTQKVFFVTDDLGDSKSYELTQNDIKTIQQTNYDTIIEELPDASTMQDEQSQRISQSLQSFGKILPPSIATQLVLMLLKLSQIKGKDEMIAEFQKQVENVQPDLPKTQLQLQWAELTPEEKVAFATMMKLPELAQAITINPDLPNSSKKEAGETQRAQIKSQTDILTEGIKNDGKRSSDKA